MQHVGWNRATLGETQTQSVFSYIFHTILQFHELWETLSGNYLDDYTRTLAKAFIPQIHCRKSLQEFLWHGSMEHGDYHRAFWIIQLSGL